MVNNNKIVKFHILIIARNQAAPQNHPSLIDTLNKKRMDYSETDVLYKLIFSGISKCIRSKTDIEVHKIKD